MTAREKYIEENAKALVAEMMRFLSEQERVKGRLMSRELSAHFLAGFIGAQVLSALTDRPSHIKSNKAMMEFTSKNFSALKTEVQEGVAAGFQAAMQEFTGRQVEYYCQVQPVPDAINKQPC